MAESLRAEAAVDRASNIAGDALERIMPCLDAAPGSS